MNSIRNSLGMPETEIVREPNRLWNPYFYAISAQVHNTLLALSMRSHICSAPRYL
jgi:hypothetical protein